MREGSAQAPGRGEGSQPPIQQQPATGEAAGEHQPAGSSGIPSPLQPGKPAAGTAAAQPPQQAAQAPTAAAAQADAGLLGDSDGGEDDDGKPAEPLSLEEEEGLAALLAALKQWLHQPHALNDVPLSITNPKVRQRWGLAAGHLGRRTWLDCAARCSTVALLSSRTAAQGQVCLGVLKC
jgi:hypothetical protein